MRRLVSSFVCVLAMALLVPQAAMQITMYRLVGDWSCWLFVLDLLCPRDALHDTYFYKDAMTTVSLLVIPIVMAALLLTHVSPASRFGRWVGGIGICIAISIIAFGAATVVMSRWDRSPFLWINVRLISVQVFENRVLASMSNRGKGRFRASVGLTGTLTGGTPQWAICTKFPGSFLLISPLWMILWAISIPSLALYLASRRPLPGHCRCGYNLTGNTSGICPECGTTVTKTAISPSHIDSAT